MKLASLITSHLALVLSSKHCLTTTTTMTKRTASLAAAAQKTISSKAPKTSRKVEPKPKVKPKPAAKTTKTKDNNDNSITVNEDSNSPDNNIYNKPWYTMFTKSDPEYDRYMSSEWGREKRGDQALFEKICLEGAQSGLSWLTILRKREAYRSTFFNFEIAKVARMTDKDIKRILEADEEDPTNMVVRHRGKIEATINNAKCIQEMYQEEDDDGDEMVHKNTKPRQDLFDKFLWSFVDDKPILNTRWKQGEGLTNALVKSPESEAMSKALKKKGFRFVGPTTCYAMMQSVGMVIDHPVGSPEWEAAVERLKQRPGGYQQDVDLRGEKGKNESVKGAVTKSKKKGARDTTSTGTSSKKRAKKK